MALPNSPVSDDQLCAKFVQSMNEAIGAGKDLEARLSALAFDTFAPRLHAAEVDIDSKFKSLMPVANAVVRLTIVRDAALFSFSALIGGIAERLVDEQAADFLKTNDKIMAFCAEVPPLIDALHEKILNDLNTFSMDLNKVYFCYCHCIT